MTTAMRFCRDYFLSLAAIKLLAPAAVLLTVALGCELIAQGWRERHVAKKGAPEASA